MLFGLFGQLLDLLGRDLRRLFRRHARLVGALQVAERAAGHAAQQAGRDVGEQLVEHAGALVRVAVVEQLAHHLRERRRLVGAQRLGHALRHLAARRGLGHAVEVVFGLGRIGVAGAAQVLLQQVTKIKAHDALP